jgi:hypothetical protein
MGKILRNMPVVCILIVLSVFLGCGSDNGVTVQDTPAPPVPPVPPALGGTFGVYSTPGGDRPGLYDTGDIVAIYVVHKVPEGAMASEFKIGAPTGWTLVGAKSRFSTTIGDVHQGISIGYGSCLTGSINLMTLTYQTPGNATPGTEFEVLPHPDWPQNIQVVDCNANLLDGARGLATPVELWQFNPGTGTGDKPRPKSKR